MKQERHIAKIVIILLLAIPITILGVGALAGLKTPATNKQPVETTSTVGPQRPFELLPDDGNSRYRFYAIERNTDSPTEFTVWAYTDDNTWVKLSKWYADN